MEEKNHTTAYDEMMQTRELQMLKTIVPYMNSGQQMQMVLMIQYLELSRSIQMMRRGENALSAYEIPEGTDRRTAMLSDLRCFCSPKEQEAIDTLLNLFCIMDNYEMMM